jgi:hypothetical protein
LETDGLDTTVRFVGGKLESNVRIAGVCLAVSEFEGYYLPAANNGLDGVPNWGREEVVEFLQRCVDEFFLVYYNAEFDLCVMRNSGVLLNDEFSDVHLLGRVSCKWEFEKGYVEGLKKNSAHYLNRKMVELQDLLGSKEFINFDRLAAVDSVVYGASDACNTVGLFKMYTSPKFTRNPYKEQELATRLVHKSVRVTMSLLTWGLPVDYRAVKMNVLTIIRRIFIVEDKFREIVGSDIIGSGEEVGIWLGGFLQTRWTGGEQGFYTYLEQFGMTNKIKKLKSGVEKRCFTTAEDCLEKLREGTNRMEFLDEEGREIVRNVIDLVLAYRGLVHDQALFLNMLKSVKFDDRGYAYVNVILRQEGADTGRYTGKAGDGLSRIEFKGQYPVFVKGNGICLGMNVQGIPKKGARFVKAKRVLRMDKSLEDKLAELDVRVQARFRELLKGYSAKGR